jgi:pimeloyl-ACP methyl ester carboxylesterase
MNRTHLRATTLALCLALAAAPVAFAAPKAPAPAAAAAPAFQSHRFTVEVRGHGPDVILIPGLSSSREVWRGLATRLERDHTVHLVQVSGFAGQPADGNAEGLVVAPTVEEIARYIEARGLKAPAVIGHSLGGEAALMLAARHPASAGRVMVVDAVPFIGLLGNPNATSETVRPQADMMRDAVMNQSDEAWAAGQVLTMARLVKDPAARARGVAAGTATDRRVAARAVHELMVTDLRPELKAITAPVTVLYAYDAQYGVPPEVIDRTFARAYAALPSARLVRVDDSFHFIMDDQPERFASEVEAFLAP